MSPLAANERLDGARSTAPAAPRAAARDAQGRAAHPHRGLARARADLRAGAEATASRSPTRASRRCARRTPSPTCRASSTSTTPARACCCTSSDFDGDGDGVLPPRRRRQRRPRRALLRSADAHRARRADRRPSSAACAAPASARRARARRHERADPVLPAPPERGRGARDARRRAAVSRALHRRRPRQQRARPSAGEVRARVRRRPASSACTASRTPARKGRRPTSRARSTCCTSSASTTACAASRDPALVERLARERRRADRVPAVERQAAASSTELADHNLAELLRAGIKATINSDDPAYFGGYINDNFIATFEALPQLGAADAYALAQQQLRRELRRRRRQARLAVPPRRRVRARLTAERGAMSEELEAAGALVTASAVAGRIEAVRGAAGHGGAKPGDGSCRNCGAAPGRRLLPRVRPVGPSASLPPASRREVLHGVLHFDAKGWRTCRSSSPGRAC